MHFKDYIEGIRLLISSSFDGTIKIWDIDSLRCIKTLKTNDSFIWSLCCDENYLYSGSKDGIIRIWSLDTYKLVRKINSFNKSTIHYLIADESFLYAQLQNTKLLQKWEKNNFKNNTIIKCDGYTGGFRVLGDFIYTESYPNIVKINKYSNDIISSNYLTHEDFYTIDIDDKYIYTGYMVFSKENFEKITKLGPNNYEIHQTAFDNKYFYYSSVDIDYIPVWKKDSWKLVKKLQSEPKDRFESILVTNENVIAGGLQGIYIWSKDDWKLKKSLFGHKNIVSSLVLIIQK